MAANLLEKPFSQDEMIASRYKIIEHLGVGSYGNSYLVFDHLSEENKVLKALRIHKRLTTTGRNGFELEKELLKTINHSGFPKYFEDGVYKNVPFFTMELINGKNFEQLIFQDGYKYTEAAAFMVAYQLVDLIDYLHQIRIIHRDIRIPNVLNSGNKIRLIDFGLARKLNQMPAKNKQSALEVRRGKNPQADFYGLGHFLLFLLYSNFTFQNGMKELSWEDELKISQHAKHVLKKLLQIDSPYENCAEIRLDFQKFI